MSELPKLERPELRIIEGAVEVNSVELIIEQPYLLVWVLSLTGKGASVFMSSPTTVFLQSARSLAPAEEVQEMIENAEWDEAIKLNDQIQDAEVLTRVETGLDDEWDLIADVGRYTCRIVAYRPIPVPAEYFRAMDGMGALVDDPGPEQIRALLAGMSDPYNEFVSFAPIDEEKNWSIKVTLLRRLGHYQLEIRNGPGKRLTMLTARKIDEAVTILSTQIAVMAFPHTNPFGGGPR